MAKRYATQKDAAGNYINPALAKDVTITPSNLFGTSNNTLRQGESQILPSKNQIQTEAQPANQPRVTQSPINTSGAIASGAGQLANAPDVNQRSREFALAYRGGLTVQQIKAEETRQAIKYGLPISQTETPMNQISRNMARQITQRRMQSEYDTFQTPENKSLFREAKKTNRLTKKNEGLTKNLLSQVEYTTDSQGKIIITSQLNSAQERQLGIIEKNNNKIQASSQKVTPIIEKANQFNRDYKRFQGVEKARIKQLEAMEIGITTQQKQLDTLPKYERAYYQTEKNMQEQVAQYRNLAGAEPLPNKTKVTQAMENYQQWNRLFYQSKAGKAYQKGVDFIKQPWKEYQKQSAKVIESKQAQLNNKLNEYHSLPDEKQIYTAAGSTVTLPRNRKEQLMIEMNKLNAEINKEKAYQTRRQAAYSKIRNEPVNLAFIGLAGAGVAAASNLVAGAGVAAIATGTKVGMAGGTFLVGTTKGVVAGGSLLYGASTAANIQSIQNQKAKQIAISEELVNLAAFSAGAFVGAKASANIAKKIPKVKIENFEFVDIANTKVSYTGLGYEGVTGGKPFIGKVKQPAKVVKIVAGKQKIQSPFDYADQPFNVPVKARFVRGIPKMQFQFAQEYIPQSQIATSVFLKNIKSQVSKTQLSRLKGALEIMKATKETPSKFVRKTFTRDIESLSQKQVEVIISSTKKNKGELYGSFVQEAEMPRALFEKARGAGAKPGDIDKFFKISGVKGEEYAAKLSAELNKVKGGYQTRVSKQAPTLIESKVNNIWRHAVDIHTLDNPEVPIVKAYGLPLNQRNIKIEKIRSMPLSEQGLRKGASMLTLRSTKGDIIVELKTEIGQKNSKAIFSPASHRGKDIADFFAVQETLIKSQGSKGKGLQPKLEALKAKYPKALTEAQAKISIPLNAAKSTAKPNLGMIKSLGIASKSKAISQPLALSKAFKSYASPSQSKSLSISLSLSPSRSPSVSPSKSPSISLSRSLSVSPSKSPSLSPSVSPSRSPSVSPSISPSLSPSRSPSVSPSMSPSLSPSVSPSMVRLPRSPPPMIPARAFDMGGFGRNRGFIVPKRKKQSKKYTPDITGFFFNIHGKKNKRAIQSGLGIRPLTKAFQM